MANCCGHCPPPPIAAGESPTCPHCLQLGLLVAPITPQHTLKQQWRSQITADTHTYFCPTPTCATVYFQPADQSSYSQQQLIKRVTRKDDHPNTPLCYCYKITKGAVTEQIRSTGSTNVIAQIQAHMQQHPCFCDKSNPSGRCCLDEVHAWLAANLPADSHY